MAIARYNTKKTPKQDKVVVQTMPDVSLKPKPEPVYDTATTTLTQIPVINVLKYMNGYAWSVDYYRQVLQSDDPIQTNDPKLSSSLQQYEIIKDYKLQVTTSLSSEVMSDTGVTIVTGAAIVYGPFVPNTGDVFTARILNGRPAIFSVINVNAQSYDRNRVYEIEYKLRAYTDTPDGETILKDINNKEVNTYYYDKDANNEVSAPILSSERKNIRDKLDTLYWETIEYYMDNFFDRELKTLLVPDMSSYIYDHWLVKHILSVTNTTDHECMLEMTLYDVDAESAFKKETIWDILKSKAYRKLTKVIQKVSLLPPKSLPRNLINGSIRYSNIDYLVYKEDNIGVGFTETLTGQTTSTVPTLSSLVENSLLTPLGSVDMVPSIDDYYVLSSNFYNKTGNYTLLEKITLDYLENKALNEDEVSKLIESYTSWGNTQQFYYLPVVWLLIRDVRPQLYGFK